MIFTEDNIAFVKIFVPYYRLWTTESYMREFPGKRQNTFGLDKLIKKLLKRGMSKCTHGVAYRRLKLVILVCW